jgi:hypothetical protein
MRSQLENCLNHIVANYYRRSGFLVKDIKNATVDY